MLVLYSKNIKIVVEAGPQLHNIAFLHLSYLTSILKQCFAVEKNLVLLISLASEATQVT